MLISEFIFVVIAQLSVKIKSLVSSNCTIDFWKALEIVFVYRQLKHDNAGADKTKHYRESSSYNLWKISLRWRSIKLQIMLRLDIIYYVDIIFIFYFDM